MKNTNIYDILDKCPYCGSKEPCYHCWICGGNIYSKEHKPECPFSHSKKLSKKAKKKYKKQKITFKPIELMMLRDPADICEYTCPTCGMGYTIRGKKFRSQDAANMCCFYDPAELVRRQDAVREEGSKKSTGVYPSKYARLLK